MQNLFVPDDWITKDGVLLLHYVIVSELNILDNIFWLPRPWAQRTAEKRTYRAMRVRTAAHASPGRTKPSLGFRSDLFKYSFIK